MDLKWTLMQLLEVGTELVISSKSAVYPLQPPQEIAKTLKTDYSLIQCKNGKSLDMFFFFFTKKKKNNATCPTSTEKEKRKEGERETHTDRSETGRRLREGRLGWGGAGRDDARTEMANTTPHSGHKAAS